MYVDTLYILKGSFDYLPINNLLVGCHAGCWQVGKKAS
jgi:hypothetical protein